ncbi:Serine-threonine/tyrosine-protein kinase, catalytic domain [Dillenia turbinata]|uniref:Serine-threonine/tyrosine-protein kinase, catalytic domain n=1 Tax=Dillenia turbinata TaxID=194707 RepID=A0AAN8UXY1_9MAGN
MGIGSQPLLVYEYMESNYPVHALFGSSDLELDWAAWQKICVRIATALAFLNNESQLMNFHSNIKATNVSLEGDLNAKISNFGLAMLNDEENAHISTCIAGTLDRICAKDRSLLSSFRPMNNCAFIGQWRANLMELVDPTLGTDYNKDQDERVIKVALFCTNASLSPRPPMSSVLLMLEGKKTTEEVISDPAIYANDLRFEPLRDHYQQMHYSNISPQMELGFLWPLNSC